MTTKANTEEKIPAAAPAAPKPAAKAVSPKPAAKIAAPKPVSKTSAPKPVAEAPKAAQPAEKAAKPGKTKASKVIRDSFTFPETDYQKISELKKSCLAIGINAKKSEILRAGLHALASLDKDRLKEVISKVEKIKTGRPLGSEKS